MVPSSADPRGHWNRCKVNPAACNTNQLTALQGVHFLPILTFKSVSSFSTVILIRTSKHLYVIFQISGAIWLLLFIHFTNLQEEMGCSSIHVLLIAKVSHKIHGLLLTPREYTIRYSFRHPWLAYFVHLKWLRLLIHKELYDMII